MSEGVTTEVLGRPPSKGSDGRSSDGDASSISPSPQPVNGTTAAAGGAATTTTTTASSDLSEEGDDVSESKTSDGALPSAKESAIRDKLNKKGIRTPRPAMEIYRPPGLRKNTATVKSMDDLSTKPNPVAGKKQLRHSMVYNGHGNGNLQWKGENFQRNKVKQRSMTCCVTRSYFPKQKQDKSSLPLPPPLVAGAADRQHGCKRQHSFVKDVTKKKEFSDEDVKEVEALFAALEIDSDEDVTSWKNGKFENKEVASSVGKKLVQAAVENGKNIKQISKLSAILISCPSGEDFHKRLLSSCREYFDSKEKLRKEEFVKWQSFINFVSELYGSMGFSYEDEIVDIVLNIFNFLLLPPVLEEINIEELECVISALLNIGYDLERQCPDRLMNLRDTIRDALIQATEPWARKMILLLVELSASNWKLPSDANAYYFETQPCA